MSSQKKIPYWTPSTGQFNRAFRDPTVNGKRGKIHHLSKMIPRDPRQSDADDRAQGILVTTFVKNNYTDAQQRAMADGSAENTLEQDLRRVGLYTPHGYTEVAWGAIRKLSRARQENGSLNLDVLTKEANALLSSQQGNRSVSSPIDTVHLLLNGSPGSVFERYNETFGSAMKHLQDVILSQNCTKEAVEAATAKLSPLLGGNDAGLNLIQEILLSNPDISAGDAIVYRDGRNVSTLKKDGIDPAGINLKHVVKYTSLASATIHCTFVAMKGLSGPKKKSQVWNQEEAADIFGCILRHNNARLWRVKGVPGEVPVKYEAVEITDVHAACEYPKGDLYRLFDKMKR